MRIEQALEQARISIDPFKNTEEQSKDVVEKLRTIIPMKSE
jgi:ribosome maturation protein SDO1